MTFIAVRCPHCQSDQIGKRGKTARGPQRDRCQHPLCPQGRFLLAYCHRGGVPAVKHPIIAMSLPASGGRDTARSWPMCPKTVRRELKKHDGGLAAVNPTGWRTLHPVAVAWAVERAGEAEAERDERGAFVGHKGNPRGLWPAREPHTGKGLADVFGRRQDAGCVRLKALLEPCGRPRYATASWGAYTRHLAPDEHGPGQRHTQTIERTHLP